MAAASNAGVSASARDRQPHGAIEQAGIEVRQPVVAGEPLGQRALARGGGSVDGNDHNGSPFAETGPDMLERRHELREQRGQHAAILDADARLAGHAENEETHRQLGVKPRHDLSPAGHARAGRARSVPRPARRSRRHCRAAPASARSGGGPRAGPSSSVSPSAKAAATARMAKSSAAIGSPAGIAAPVSRPCRTTMSIMPGPAPRPAGEIGAEQRQRVEQRQPRGAGRHALDRRSRNRGRSAPRPAG